MVEINDKEDVGELIPSMNSENFACEFEGTLYEAGETYEADCKVCKCLDGGLPLCEVIDGCRTGKLYNTVLYCTVLYCTVLH